MTPVNDAFPTDARPRVLIVDDEPDIEDLIRQRFKRRHSNFDFMFARDGREALERLRADESIDLVVTDINMPVMDGLTLLGRLNSLNGRVVKAVILSAYGDMENIRTAMNRGAFDFLTKPIDFQDFETTLQRGAEALRLTREGLEARAQLSALHYELDIAARIQMSMLPQTFELPGRRDFDVYAQTVPARRVGGDFYDFFLIDENRLGFLVGDVSGKGVPAALFMAVSRTLLRATALQDMAPAKCLQYANEILGGQSEPGVYVTAFYGILHTDTGHLDYCIGGHNPPYRVLASGELQRIEEPGSAILGLLANVRYEEGRLQLSPGDSVFLFTDGVTEANKFEESFFGERRLREVLASTAGKSPQEMVDAVQSAVAEYIGNAPQSDDITALALRWNP